MRELTFRKDRDGTTYIGGFFYCEEKVGHMYSGYGNGFNLFCYDHQGIIKSKIVRDVDEGSVFINNVCKIKLDQIDGTSKYVPKHDHTEMDVVATNKFGITSNNHFKVFYKGRLVAECYKEEKCQKYTVFMKDAAGESAGMFDAGGIEHMKDKMFSEGINLLNVIDIRMMRDTFVNNIVDIVETTKGGVEVHKFYYKGVKLGEVVMEGALDGTNEFFMEDGKGNTVDSRKVQNIHEAKWTSVNKQEQLFREIDKAEVMRLVNADKKSYNPLKGAWHFISGGWLS